MKRLIMMTVLLALTLIGSLYASFWSVTVQTVYQCENCSFSLPRPFIGFRINQMVGITQSYLVGGGFTGPNGTSVIWYPHTHSTTVTHLRVTLDPIHPFFPPGTSVIDVPVNEHSTARFVWPLSMWTGHPLSRCCPYVPNR